MSKIEKRGVEGDERKKRQKKKMVVQGDEDEQQPVSKRGKKVRSNDQALFNDGQKGGEGGKGLKTGETVSAAAVAKTKDVTGDSKLQRLKDSTFDDSMTRNQGETSSKDLLGTQVEGTAPSNLPGGLGEQLEVEKVDDYAQSILLLKYQKKLFYIDLLVAILASLMIIMVIVESTHYNECMDPTDGLITIFRLVLCGLGFVLSLVLILRQSALIQRYYHQGRVFSKSCISRTHLASSALTVTLEIMIVLIFPYPYLDAVLENDDSSEKYYNYDQIVSSLAILKAFFIVRLIPQLTAVKNDISRKIYDQHGVPIDNNLFLKIQLKERPVIILGLILALVTIMFGFAVQMYERAIALGLESYDKFADVFNSMWIVILGITTVGYGDITPATHISRLLVVFACYIGNIVLILITVTFSNMINHNEKEEKAYGFINNFKNRYELRSRAASVIQRYYRYNLSFSTSKRNKAQSSSNNDGGFIGKKLYLQQAVERFREYREVWFASQLGNTNSLVIKESIQAIESITKHRIEKIKGRLYHQQQQQQQPMFLDDAQQDILISLQKCEESMRRSGDMLLQNTKLLNQMWAVKERKQVSRNNPLPDHPRQQLQRIQETFGDSEDSEDPDQQDEEEELKVIDRQDSGDQIQDNPQQHSYREGQQFQTFNTYAPQESQETLIREESNQALQDQSQQRGAQQQKARKGKKKGNNSRNKIGDSLLDQMADDTQVTSLAQQYTGMKPPPGFSIFRDESDSTLLSSGLTSLGGGEGSFSYLKKKNVPIIKSNTIAKIEPEAPSQQQMIIRDGEDKASSHRKNNKVNPELVPRIWPESKAKEGGTHQVSTQGLNGRQGQNILALLSRNHTKKEEQDSGGLSRTFQEKRDFQFGLENLAQHHHPGLHQSFGPFQQPGASAIFPKPQNPANPIVLPKPNGSKIDRFKLMNQFQESKITQMNMRDNVSEKIQVNRRLNMHRYLDQLYGRA